MRRLLSTIGPDDEDTRICGWLRRCPGCLKLFLGRWDAKACSDACRQKVFRRKGAPVDVPDIPEQDFGRTD